MEHDEVADLLAVHAVGAVRGADRLAIEEHLQVCEACRVELRSLTQAVVVLGPPGRRIPDDIRAEVALAIKEAQGGRPPLQRDAWRRRRSVAVAGAAAVLVTGVIGVVYRQQQRIDELTVALSDPAPRRVDEVTVTPGSDRFELRSPDGQIAVAAVISERGEGLLDASALPRLGADRTYQLWGIDGDRVVSLALLGAEPRAAAFGAQIFSTFAITNESAGGSAQPSLPSVVQGARP